MGPWCARRCRQMSRPSNRATLGGEFLSRAPPSFRKRGHFSARWGLDKEIHVILHNYSTHKNNHDWLAKFEGRMHFHFTPTSASWLNQIEILFSLLQRKALNTNSLC